MDDASKKLMFTQIVSGIKNQTNSSSQKSADGGSSTIDSNSRITMAKALSSVTDIMKDNPTLIDKNTKQELKTVIKSMVDFDSTDESYYSSTFENSTS